jgi:hypothetical protein
MVIARQLLGKQVYAETNKQAIIMGLLGYNDENGVSVGSALRLYAYNEDPRPAELELSESLETAVEDD